MISPVAIRSFKSRSAASAALTRLETVGIRCRLLTAHDNLAVDAWLFASYEQSNLARKMARGLPSDILHHSRELAPISEADIVVYASKFGDRHSYQWLLWLTVVLWPLIFHRGVWWAVASLLVFASVAFTVKGHLGCPCCGTLPMRTVRNGDFVQCPNCGIRSLRPRA